VSISCCMHAAAHVLIKAISCQDSGSAACDSVSNSGNIFDMSACFACSEVRPCHGSAGLVAVRTHQLIDCCGAARAGCRRPRGRCPRPSAARACLRRPRPRRTGATTCRAPASSCCRAWPVRPTRYPLLSACTCPSCACGACARVPAALHAVQAHAVNCGVVHTAADAALRA
jgi:hypothetical protein